MCHIQHHPMLNPQTNFDLHEKDTTHRILKLCDSILRYQSSRENIIHKYIHEQICKLQKWQTLWFSQENLEISQFKPGDFKSYL